MRSLPVCTVLVRSHTCPTSRDRSPTPSSRTSPSSRVPSLPCPSSRVPYRTRPSSPYRVSACTRSTPRVPCVRLWLPTYTSRGLAGLAPLAGFPDESRWRMVLTARQEASRHMRVDHTGVAVAGDMECTGSSCSPPNPLTAKLSTPPCLFPPNPRTCWPPSLLPHAILCSPLTFLTLAAYSLLSSSLLAGLGEGRGGQHRHYTALLPCGCAGGSGGRGGGQHSTRLGRDERASGLGRLKQGHLASSEDCSGASAALCSLSHNQLMAPPCSRLANSLLALALSPFLPSLPTDQLCVCALQVEGRGGGQHRRFLTPLPCGRAVACGDGREAALPVAATKESIGVGLASQGTSPALLPSSLSLSVLQFCLLDFINFSPAFPSLVQPTHWLLLPTFRLPPPPSPVAVQVPVCGDGRGQLCQSLPQGRVSGCAWPIKATGHREKTVAEKLSSRPAAAVVAAEAAAAAAAAVGGEGFEAG
ncbi:unnamed protein product [Closterium sp. NIES-65]|nr:unnamed protein product [Closterium sp. NIES-65]